MHYICYKHTLRDRTGWHSARVFASDARDPEFDASKILRTGNILKVSENVLKVLGSNPVSVGQLSRPSSAKVQLAACMTEIPRSFPTAPANPLSCDGDVEVKHPGGDFLHARRTL